MSGRKRIPAKYSKYLENKKESISETIRLKSSLPIIYGTHFANNAKIFTPEKSKIETQRNRSVMPSSPLTRYEDNPLISPRDDSWWESRQTFNPAAVLLEGEIHMLYRAIGEDGISRLGYADTGKGFELEERLEYPVYQHPVNSFEYAVYSYSSGGSFGGCEDPRLVHVMGEDRLYMTYTACDRGLRVGLTSIKVKDFLEKKWNWASPKLISPPGEIHKNWVIFPEKLKGKYAVLHSLTPQISIAYLDTLEFKPGTYLLSNYSNGNSAGREQFWDSVIRGVGPPPIKTRLGWLLFYHAMDRYESSKYKVGALLTDLKDPKRVIRCAASPVLEPKVIYEESGFKPGVVYLTSAIVRDGELILCYGASDSYVCVVSCELEEFLDALIKGGRTVFIKTEVPSTLISRRNTRRIKRQRHTRYSAEMTTSIN